MKKQPDLSAATPEMLPVYLRVIWVISGLSVIVTMVAFLLSALKYEYSILISIALSIVVGFIFYVIALYGFVIVLNIGRKIRR